MKSTEINKLKNYFKKRKDIAFAFLYSSQENYEDSKLTSGDTAVYFYPYSNTLEYDEFIIHDGEYELCQDLQRLLNRKIDLLILNKAPSYIASKAIRGTALAVNSWGIYLDYITVVGNIGDDFFELRIKHYTEE